MCGSYNCRPMNTTKRLKNDPVVHQTVKQWKSLVTKVTLCNACACTHIQTHTHTRTHAHTHTRTHTRVHAGTHTRTHISNILCEMGRNMWLQKCFMRSAWYELSTLRVDMRIASQRKKRKKGAWLSAVSVPLFVFRVSVLAVICIYYVRVFVWGVWMGYVRVSIC